MLRNEKGSIISVVIILIAVLSFSLTTITAYSINVVGQTNRIVTQQNNESRAKRLIEQAMVSFEDEIRANILDYGMEWFDDLTLVNSNDDIPLMEAIYDEMGVTVTFDDSFNYLESEMSVTSRRYRFSYPVDEDRDIVRYIYMSNHGVEFESYNNAFLFSIGSDRDLVINGGAYQDANMYGRNTYIGWQSPYRGVDGIFDIVTGSPSHPYFMNLGQINGANHNICQVNTHCIQVDEVNNVLRMYPQHYVPMEAGDITRAALASTTFDSLFGDFNFTNNFFRQLYTLGDPDNNEYLSGTQPNESNILTFIDDNVALGNLRVVTQDGIATRQSITEHSVYYGDLNLTIGNNVTLDNDGHIFIVTGDLTITSLREITGHGQIFVLGDVHIETEGNFSVDAAVFTLGSTYINFELGYGFTRDQHDGFSIFSRGHIFMDFQDNYRITGGQRGVGLLLFTESSMFINGAIGQHGLQGALYAQGRNEGLEDVLKYNAVTDEYEPFRGIFINSYKGQFRANHMSWQPSNNDNFHTFGISSMVTDGNRTRLFESFVGLPEFETITLIPGELYVEKGTFRYERRIN